jgi:hypothetical protein
MFIPSPELEFTKWVSLHPWVLDYISISSLSPHPSDSAMKRFKQQRTAKYNRFCLEIAEFLRRLELEQQKIVSEMDSLSRKPVAIVDSRIFPESDQNFALQQLTVACRTLAELNQTITNSLHIQILEYLDRARLISHLFIAKAVTLGDDCMVSIKKSFFELSPEISADLRFQQTALMSYISHKRALIADFKSAISNPFSTFFDEIIANQLSNLNEEISYLPPSSDEVLLSRYIFNGGFPQIATEIDELIRLLDDPNQFSDSVLQYSLKLIPNRNTKTSKEQSVAVMIIFRIVFDRLYEKKWKSLMIWNENDREVLIRASHFPVKFFRFPHDQRLTEFHEMEVREYFLTHFSREDPTMLLNQLMFLTNPIDCLFCVHESTSHINRAIIFALIGNEREVTSKDLRQVLGFDDTFSVLVGVILASDLPELFSVVNFITNFVPRSSLSCAFEYSQAALTALVSHLPTLQNKEFNRLDSDGDE